MTSYALSILSHPALYELPEFQSGTSAWEQHIPFAFWLIHAARPRTVVELGTHKGDSYLAFCQAIKKLNLSSAAYAVDTWIGETHTGNYDEGVYSTLEKYHSPRYGSFSTLLRCSFDEARPSFRDESIDILHIDGLHTYEAVKHDFQTWLPKLSHQGIILFHDTQVRDREFGVWKLWQELTEQYPHFEFLHGSGLGVLGVGEHLPSSIAGLFCMSAEEVKSLQEACHCAGHRTALYGGYRAVEADRNYRVTQLEELRTRFEELRAQQQHLNSRVSELSIKHSALIQEHNSKETRIQELTDCLDTILNSTSWKVTGPLRAIKSVFGGTLGRR